MGIIAESWITDESVQLKVHRARGLRRLVGLIGQRPPAAGSALLFTRCNSVHGVGIRAPLDVVFVDNEWRVTSVRALHRFRFIYDRRARHTFELAPGEAQRLGIRPGAVLQKKFSEGGGKQTPLNPLTKYEDNFQHPNSSGPDLDRRG